MSNPYNPKEIEPKWQKYWEERGMYKAEDFSKKPKQYVLDMFPYPSGEGLHVGHVEGYTATDVMSRYLRMRGKNVLHPMGWDAFGLPAENYAIKTKTHPRIATERNIAQFARVLKRMGFSYDWSREINTTDPEYYKWTQWIFLQLFKKGLAYQAEAPINFCPQDGTALADEEVENGSCVRCGSVVERRFMKQWMLKITAYADRLLEDLEGLEWPEHIKQMQRNWIGRSEGSEILFPIKGTKNNYVLLHGRGGSPEKNFFPWLRKELEKLGYHVEVPLLPHADKPHIEEQVEFLLKNVRFSSDTVVVTHSLGGVAAMKLIPRLEHQIAKLVMIAPPARPEFIDHPRPDLEQCTDWKFDFDVVKTKTGEIVVLSDLNDDIIPPEQPRELASALGATLIETVAKSHHFDTDKEPEILSYAQPHLRVFTTRADTLFGATYVVVAPEHSLFTNNQLPITNNSEVRVYIEQAKQKTDFERHEHTKSGVRVEGIVAVNPANNAELPVLIADYVLATYGTGVIMAVPAHDSRDFAFAHTHNLPILEVISPDGRERKELDAAYVDDGILVNSPQFSGKTSIEARKSITKWLQEKGLAKTKIYYKLRDWIFSRQRYWGEPIPIVHCQNCGTVAVPEGELPVTLPEVERYEPTGTGESPLARIESWVNTNCPSCGGPGQRETNTMPQWAGSCWYYLAFAMRGSSNTQAPGSKYEWDKDKINYWMEPGGVDLYVGGAEHAVLHLLYARFWHKVLYDIGAVSGKEPFLKFMNQGMILGPDNQKMSKSRGNVVPADDVINEYGADTLRMYELFLGPLEYAKPWDTRGTVGIWRFLNKASNLANSQQVEAKSENNAVLMHRTIKKVTEDIEKLRFNTAISALMEYVNAVSNLPPTNYHLQTLVVLLAPFAPHLAEELWQEVLGKQGSVHEQAWPKYDPKQIIEAEVTIVVQVNGRTRAQVRARRGAVESEVQKTATLDAAVARHLAGKTVRRIIFVPDKLINIVAQ